MDSIHRISERFRVDVIEDAAQAIGAEYPFGGRSAKAGTMGEVGCFSFYPTKNLGAAGDAGMVICRDHALAERIRACRQHGMEPRYFHYFIGGNFRLDEIQAAILAVKLPFLDGWSAARRAVADFYREEFVRLGLTNQIALPAEPYRGRRRGTRRATRGSRAYINARLKRLAGRYRSGQTGRTVNPLAYAFVGSNPTLPIYSALLLAAALASAGRFLRRFCPAFCL